MLLFSFVLFSCNEVRRINDNGVCTIDLDNVQKKESCLLYTSDAADE